MDTPQNPSPTEQAGVEGWLLVLCLILTCWYPAIDLYRVFSQALPQLVSGQSPNRALIYGVYAGLFITTAAFSFMAGLKLWLIKPGAVSFARRYLALYLIAHIAYFLFWMVVVRPSQLPDFAEMGWYHVVAPIGSVALWFFYLEHSRRVRSTYLLG